MDFCCSQCSFAAQFESALLMHKQLHHDIKSNKLSVIGKSSFTSIKGIKLPTRTMSATRLFEKIRTRLSRKSLFPHPEENVSSDFDLTARSECTSKALKAKSSCVDPNVFSCHMCSFTADRITLLDRHLLNVHRIGLDSLLQLVMAKTKNSLYDSTHVNCQPYYQSTEPQVGQRHVGVNTTLTLADFDTDEHVLVKMKSLNDCMCKFVDTSNTLKRVLTKGLDEKRSNCSREDAFESEHESPKSWEKAHSERFATNRSRNDTSNRFDRKTDVCTCKRTRRTHEMCESLNSAEIGVGSVKALPKRHTRRVYVRETRDTAVGSGVLHGRDQTACVGVWQSEIIHANKKLSPITNNDSHATSPINISTNISTQTDVNDKRNVKSKIDRVSSDLINIQDLECNLIENKLEMEYRKMFETVEADDQANIRRFEKLTANVSVRNVSVTSDPPSLEAKSYSNDNIHKPNTGCDPDELSSVIIESQSVRAMFKLWGKKFNLDEEKPGKMADRPGKKSKFFHFNKRKRKNVTANRCEIEMKMDEHVMKIMDRCELDPDTRRTETGWLKRFLTGREDSRRSVKIRWNNKMYSASSDCVYRAEDDSDKCYVIPRTIEAWMIPQIKRHTPQIQNNENVTYLDREWHIDKSHRGNRIELILKSDLYENDSDYILIDIPRDYFTESSQSEEVFKITDYESHDSKPSVKRDLGDTGDHIEGNVRYSAVPNLAKSGDTCQPPNADDKCGHINSDHILNDPGDDEMIGDSQNQTKFCDVIGVGIITQRDLRDIKPPVLKIQDTDSISAQHLPPPKTCEFAESYLQDYCRNWVPLGIDFFSWCVSDTQLDSHTSLNNQGDGTKSCPNVCDETVLSYNSSCSQEEPKKLNFLSKLFGKHDTDGEKRFQPKDSIEVFKRRRVYAEGYNSKWNNICPKPPTPVDNTKPKKHVSIPECEPYDVVEQPCDECFPGILNLVCGKPRKDKHAHVIPDPLCVIPSKPLCSNKCSKECNPPCFKGKKGKSPPVCTTCPPLTSSEIVSLMKRFPECPSLPQKCPQCKTTIPPQKCNKCFTLMLPKNCPKCSAPVAPLKCSRCAKAIMPQQCPKCPSSSVPLKCPKCTMELVPQKCPQCNSILIQQNCTRCSSQIIPFKCPTCATNVRPPICPKCCVPLPQQCPNCTPPAQTCPNCSVPLPVPKCHKCRQKISPKKCSQCSLAMLPSICPKCQSQINPQVCPKCSIEVLPQKCPKCVPQSPIKKILSGPLPHKCPTCSSPLEPQNCPKCRTLIAPKSCPKCFLAIATKCNNCDSPVTSKCPKCSSPLPQSCPKCPAQCPKSCSPIRVQKCPRCFIPVLTQKCPNCCSLLGPTSPSQTSLQSSPNSTTISQNPSTQSIPECSPCQVGPPRSKPMSGIKLEKPRYSSSPNASLALPTPSKGSLNSKTCQNKRSSNDLQKTPTQEIREGCNIKVQDEDGQTLYERIDYRSNKHESRNKICADSNIHRVSTPSIVLNTVALNNDAQKNDSNENFIEINLTLKFKGDKTEINICNPETQRQEQPGGKPKEIFHMQDVRESVDAERNDVNIKIFIKNATANDDVSKHALKDNSNQQTDEFSQNISNKFNSVSTGYSEFVLDQTIDKVIDTSNVAKSYVKVSSSLTECTDTVSSIKNGLDNDLKTDLSERDTTEVETAVSDEERHENYFTETIKKLHSRREKKEMLKRLFESEVDRHKVRSVRHMLRAILTDSEDSNEVARPERTVRNDSLTNVYDSDNVIVEERKSDILYPTKENSDTLPRCMCKAMADKLNMDFPKPCCCGGCDQQDEGISCDLVQGCRSTNMSTVRVVRQIVLDSHEDVLQSEELKKAVLEIYAERTLTAHGARYVARLPKLVFDT